jgi:hypothetical protein
MGDGLYFSGTGFDMFAGRQKVPAVVRRRRYWRPCMVEGRQAQVEADFADDLRARRDAPLEFHVVVDAVVMRLEFVLVGRVDAQQALLGVIVGGRRQAVDVAVQLLVAGVADGDRCGQRHLPFRRRGVCWRDGRHPQQEQPPAQQPCHGLSPATV